MTPTALLTTQQTLDLLATLDGWNLAEDHRALVKTFAFANFNAAFGWMTRVALAAEKNDHHPDWHNVYGKIDVSLSSHDVGGITIRDVELARLMNRFAARDHPPSQP